METIRVLNFDPGQTQETVLVEILDDDVVEVTEEFEAVLSSPSAGVSLGVSLATVEILDVTGKNLIVVHLAWCVRITSRAKV